MNKTDVFSKKSLSLQNLQRGFTLIELLVSMFIGLLVIAGTTQIFIGTKQTYRVQQAASRLQENGRFALDMLRMFAQMTGYRNDSQKSLHDVFDKNEGFDLLPDQVDLQKSQIIRGFDGDDSGAQADKLVLRYDSPADIANLNCANSEVTGEVIIQFALDDTGTLLCTVKGKSSQPLVDEIRDMEFLYGVDLGTAPFDPSNPSYDKSADAYLTATEINDNHYWLRVVSVKVALLLSSDEDNVATDPQTYTFPPADFGSESQQVTATDRRLYRVFHTTINLRNLTP
jgi:type IV pilus assembly protein PilW